MRRTLLTSCLVLLATALAPAPLAAPAAAQQQQANWTSFRSDEGGFSILFPAAPSRDEKPLPPGPGSPGRTVIFMAKASVGIWLAGLAEYDPNFKFGVQAELDANRDNFLKGVGGTLLSSKPMTLGTAPGLEFTAEKPGQWFAKGRIFIVGRRPYQVLAMVGPQNAQSPEIDLFLGSLRVDGAN